MVYVLLAAIAIYLFACLHTMRWAKQEERKEMRKCAHENALRTLDLVG